MTKGVDSLGGAAESESEPAPPRGRELDAELQLHLDLLVEQLVAEGHDRAAAEAEAQRRFGDFEQLHDACAAEGSGPAGLTLHWLVVLLTSPAWCLVLMFLMTLGIHFGIENDMGGRWHIHWVMVLATAFSGPLIARAWDPRRRGSRAARLGPATALMCIGLLGLAPSLVTALHPTAIHVSPVRPVTVWDLGPGEGAQGLLELDPFRPLAEVALYGLGGPLPELLDPELRGSPPDQVERGLADGTYWLKVCLGTLFEAALLWLCLAVATWLALRPPPAPRGLIGAPDLAALPALLALHDLGFSSSEPRLLLLTKGGALLVIGSPLVGALATLARARRRWSRGMGTDEQLVRLRLQRLRNYPFVVIALSPALLYVSSAASESEPLFTRAVGPALLLGGLGGVALLRAGARACARR